MTTPPPVTDQQRSPDRSRDKDRNGDVVLVTGGTSGIGLGLATRLHAQGHRVIVTGRDLEKTRAVAQTHPGMWAVRMDVADPESVTRALHDIGAEHGHLDMLINNAGIQRRLDFTADPPPPPAAFTEEIATNLTGLIAVTSAALPLLRRAPGRARLVHIGSGLGLVPLVAAPVYSATKAAVHSFTISIREQLAGTSIDVIEVIPPVVETGLHRHQDRRPPQAMALEDFLDAVLPGIEARRREVYVGITRILRIGARVAPHPFLRIINRGS